jgi:hypothetical protein
MGRSRNKEATGSEKIKPDSCSYLALKKINFYDCTNIIHSNLNLFISDKINTFVL